jgi:hypothetical protein
MMIRRRAWCGLGVLLLGGRGWSQSEPVLDVALSEPKASVQDSAKKETSQTEQKEKVQTTAPGQVKTKGQKSLGSRPTYGTA